MEAQGNTPENKGEVIYRHSATVRITHWVNALVLLVLLMSGLQIFNAHPALYLGSKSQFDDPIMAMGAVEEGEALQGGTTIFGYAIPTTGVFGLSGDAYSGYESRGFPWWATLRPSYRPSVPYGRWGLAPSRPCGSPGLPVSAEHKKGAKRDPLLRQLTSAN